MVSAGREAKGISLELDGPFENSCMLSLHQDYREKGAFQE
jgi:hypothetical protein